MVRRPIRYGTRYSASRQFFSTIYCTAFIRARVLHFSAFRYYYKELHNITIPFVTNVPNLSPSPNQYQVQSIYNNNFTSYKKNKSLSADLKHYNMHQALDDSD